MARNKYQQVVHDIAVEMTPSGSAHLWEKLDRNDKRYYMRKARDLVDWVTRAGYELVKKEQGKQDGKGKDDALH